jgi:hypothetical protein
MTRQTNKAEPVAGAAFAARELAGFLAGVAALLMFDCGDGSDKTEASDSSEWTVAPGGYVRSGPWAGYAWIHTSGTGTTIDPSDFSALEAGSNLCATGTIGPMSDYSGVAVIGVNLNQEAGGNAPTGVWTPTGTGLRVNVSNRGDSALRVQLNGANAETDSDEQWCAELRVFDQKVFIPWSDFKTACWDVTSGSTYDMRSLASVQVFAPGDNAVAVPFDFCVVSLVVQGSADG